MVERAVIELAKCCQESEKDRYAGFHGGLKMRCYVQICNKLLNHGQFLQFALVYSW